MAKVLLIEDDNSLREIFAMRLQAEGYETLSAADGEEGLVLAMKQKPDLIIADVMMPKLNGFEMLETLQETPEMSHTKVIMMTALGQAEDRARGEKLGVVKYLVKSQVTLEDFVRVVREVLQPGGTAGSSSATPGDAPSSSTNNQQESEKPMDDQNNQTTPPAGDQPASNPMGDTPAPAGGQMSTADEQASVQGQVNDFTSGPAGDSGSPMPPATPPAEDPKPEEPKGDDNPMPGVPPAA